MPTKTNRILVGTDLSAAAKAAVWRAGRLAQAYDAGLELIHVISPREMPVYRVATWEGSRRYVAAEATGKLRAMAMEAEAKFGISVTVHLALGSPHTEIAARAHATNAGLVVVGPHGERRLRDMFIGSTAQRLQQKLRVPLLIARNRSARGYERALVAIDFTPASAEAAHAVAYLFPNAALHFLHVCNPLFETRLSLADASGDVTRARRTQSLLEASRQLDNFIRSNGLQSRRASSLVKQGYIPACIEETATELGVSVVAFGAKGKSRWEANGLGSVSETFSCGAGYDVLLAKANRWPSGKRYPDRLRQRDTEAATAGA